MTNEGRTDRFMPYRKMVEVSAALEDAGFKHVVASHLIDPEWRNGYRRDWPPEASVAWTIRLGEDSLPMERIKRLIAVAEEHGLNFWMQGRSGGDEFGAEIYVRMGTTHPTDWIPSTS